jgi:hypothetical protein
MRITDHCTCAEAEQRLRSLMTADMTATLMRISSLMKVKVKFIDGNGLEG